MGALIANVIVNALCIGIDITLCFWLRDCIDGGMAGMAVLVITLLIFAILFTSCMLSGVFEFYEIEDDDLEE